MRVLVTGGTGVIGNSAIRELLRRAHKVRLLARRATRHIARWSGVEAFDGDIRDARSIRGCADGCDAVLHIAAIVKEQLPDKTFSKVNVDGTRNLVAESQTAGARRFVLISSAGADRGMSAYHRSKLAAERIVKRSALAWTIVRPTIVYGPSDHLVSQVLKMMRALPALASIDESDQPFQPIWHEDLAGALVTTLDRSDLAGQTLEVAGAETTSLNDIVEKLSAIIARDPIRIPLPKAFRGAIDDWQRELLRESNVLKGRNALIDTLHIVPTPLDDGLRRLVNELPEQLPDEGVGSLHHKRFSAHIRGSRFNAMSLMTIFREAFTDIMPLDFEAEPHATTRVEVGNALTMKLPLRGNAQVRVEVVEPTRLLLVTIEGHPIAGATQFSTSDRDRGIEFAIDTYTRFGNVADLVGMKAGGQLLQDANWKHVVQKVVDLSGGTADDGVDTASETLDGEAAREVEKKLRAIVEARQRDESARDAEHAPQR